MWKEWAVSFDDDLAEVPSPADAGPAGKEKMVQSNLRLVGVDRQRKV